MTDKVLLTQTQTSLIFDILGDSCYRFTAVIIQVSNLIREHKPEIIATTRAAGLLLCYEPILSAANIIQSLMCLKRAFLVRVFVCCRCCSCFVFFPLSPFSLGSVSACKGQASLKLVIPLPQLSQELGLYV